MHNVKREIRFGNRANIYDNGFEGRFLNKFYKMLIEFIDISSDEALLDVACGTGELLHRLNEIKEINGYGIDNDEKMVNMAKTKCPTLNIGMAGCDNIPFQDKTFDVITVCMAYHHFENRYGFETETARLLKKDGKLYIADLRLPTAIQKSCNAILKHFNIVAYFFTVEEIIENFSKLGFVFEKCVKSGVVQIVCLKKG